MLLVCSRIFVCTCETFGGNGLHFEGGLLLRRNRTNQPSDGGSNKPHIDEVTERSSRATELFQELS